MVNRNLQNANSTFGIVISADKQSPAQSYTLETILARDRESRSISRNV